MTNHIVNELNRLYKTDWDKYNEKLSLYKGMGYKILRNYQGDHRVESNPNFIKEVFDGAFNKLFRG